MEKKRILIVDDQTSITRLLKINLEQTNRYVVRTENHPARALAAAEVFRPDLILLDVMMPELDGGELASSFRESPSLKTVPIVFLTAAALKGEVSSGSGQIGGLPFLAKPVNFAEVEGCIEKQLTTGS
jgi:two-component system OmpR family response regulator